MDKASSIAIRVFVFLLLMVIGTLIALRLGDWFFYFSLGHSPFKADWLVWFKTFWFYLYADSNMLAKFPYVKPHIERTLLPTVLFGYGIPITVFFIYLAGKKKQSLYGEARFANARDVKKAGLMHQSSGVLLGRFKGEWLQLSGPRFVALAAPTRAGKGVGIVIPNLLNWQGSVVCLDIKGENFDKTAGFRSKYQKVFKFDPFSETRRTHRYNPLSYISSDPAQQISDIQSIARIFWPRTDLDPIWNDSSVNLFQGLVLYLFDSPGVARTMGEVVRTAGQFSLLNQKGWQYLINVRAQQTPFPLSPRTISALNQYFSLPDETRNSVLGTFNAALQIFSNPMVDAATAADDFDLKALRVRLQSVFLCISPNRLGAAAPLMNLFFSQLIQVNTIELPEQNPKLKHSVLVLMDEFTAMGKVEIIEKAISYIAGYNLRLLLIYQSQAQLAATYGADSARNIITNCGCQILFAPREQSDAEEYSKILGNTTVKNKSKSKAVGLNFGKNSSGPTVNVSETQRPLMLPQEMKELGKEKSIVILEDTKPIMAEKIRYYEDAVFLERLLPAPQIQMIELDSRLLGLRVMPTHHGTEAVAASVVGGAVYQDTTAATIPAPDSQSVRVDTVKHQPYDEETLYQNIFSSND